MQEGNVNFISASKLAADQQDQKNQLLSQAQSELEKAVSLNPSYSDAMYSLGLVYDASGQKDKAIQEFTAVQQLNPQDKTVPQILANLKAGLPALQSSVPPSSKTPPASATPSDNTVKTPSEK